MTPDLYSDDFAALYVAKDLSELIALAKAVGGAKVWALLRPTDGQGQVLLSTEGHLTLDPLPAGQIARISIPVGAQVTLAAVPWARALLGLLGYQSAWTSETSALLPVWETGALIAVIGAGGADPSTIGLLQGIGLAMRRLHQVAGLNRDVDGAKYLLPRAEKSVVLATGTGKILLGTTGGLAVVERFQAAARKDMLPVVLRNAIDQDVRQVVLNDIQVNLSCLSLPEPTTVSPLVSVRFSRKTRKEDQRSESSISLESLTPTERKIYPLLVQGLQNKEIADRLSSSVHTVKHHVSHILAKCQCSDRLLQVAQAKQALPALAPRDLTVPPLTAVKPLPPLQYRIVGRKESEPA